MPTYIYYLLLFFDFPDDRPIHLSPPTPLWMDTDMCLSPVMSGTSGSMVKRTAGIHLISAGYRLRPYGPLFAMVLIDTWRSDMRPYLQLQDRHQLGHRSREQERISFLPPECRRSGMGPCGSYDTKSHTSRDLSRVVTSGFLNMLNLGCFLPWNSFMKWEAMQLIVVHPFALRLM